VDLLHTVESHLRMRSSARVLSLGNRQIRTAQLAEGLKARRYRAARPRRTRPNLQRPL